MLGVSRASLYYEPAEASQENLGLMKLIDQQYTRAPFYGSRRMTAWLQTQGYAVNRKRVARLMRVMGIEAVYAKPKLSQPGRRAQDLSLPAEKAEDRAARSSLVHGYHLHTDGPRISVPGGGNGLVQSVRVELGIVVDARVGVLPGGPARRTATEPPGNLQQRSRIAVHQRTVPR